VAISLIGVSIGRETEVASLIESFIDEHKEDLSLTMINALEGLAGEVDTQVQQLLADKLSLGNYIDELTGQVEILESKVEELEEEAE